MASSESLEAKGSKQKLVPKSSMTALTKPKKWFATHIPFLSSKADDSRLQHVKRRLLFNTSEVGEDGRRRSASSDSMTTEENINDIVDQDDSDVENVISSRLIPDFLCSIWFRMAVYVIVTFNALILGLETIDWFSEDYQIFIEVVMESTAAFFACEILLKWYCGFWIFWRSNWNIIDFVVVGLAVIVPGYHFMTCGRILRLLRACFLARTVSTFDKIGILRGLTTLIESLLISLPDMINIALLLLFILLIMAIAAQNLLGEAVPSYYGDLGSAFFSLFILTTQDGIIIQYKKFELHSLWFRSVAAVFFVLAIMAGAFIFLNIIVAISCYNLEVACEAAEKEDGVDSSDDESEHERDLTEDTSDDPAAEFLERLPVISKNKAHKGLNLLQNQKPFQLTNLSNLSVAKLEKYLLILSALEENLAEYEDIKRDLEELYDLVKNLNLLDVIQGDESNASLNLETSAVGKVSIGAVNKVSRGSDHDMRHLVDMLKRSSLRNQATTAAAGVRGSAAASAVAAAAGETTYRRPSASSDSSQGRKRLSPADAMHSSARN